MNDALFAEFPPVSTAEWDAAIAEDLRGGDPKKLIWETEDGFEVKPFYRMEDVPALPAFSDFPKGWRICAQADGIDSAMDAIARGAQAVLLRPSSAEDLDSVLSRLPLNEVEIHVRGASMLPALQKLRGSIDAEPGAAMPNFGPDFIPFVIDGDRFAALEPTITQELALALAVGSEFLANNAAPNSIAFDFPVGTNYFFEIAKLRAARLLWPRVVTAYRPSATPSVRIYAHTGAWSKTIYDPHVNLLRATTGAMSAIIGGAELLTLTDFNSAFAGPTPFSRRMAINTQLILREEAHFNELADASAGSWYIDWLTDRVAQESWKLFQAIEAKGGFAKAQDLIEEIASPARAARRAMIAERRKLFTGVNVHADPKERALANITRTIGTPRGPEDFEQLRLNAEKYEKRTGRAPRVFLLRWGDAKISRARAEFATDFFTCGGFEIVDAPAFSSLDEAASGVNAEKPDLAILCSSDSEYAALASAICPKLSCPVILADFVHLRGNALETLAAWQKKLGIGG